jgi:hypothetical protein
MPAEEIDGSGDPGGGFVSLVDSDLAVDPGDGHLYVADNLQPNFDKPKAIVVEFSPQGNFRDLVPHPRAEGEPSFLVDAEPTALAVNGSGDVYVTSGDFEEALAFIFGPGDAGPTHVLSVNGSGAGTGTIVSSPPGLHCGIACTGEFDEDSNVTVTATPTRGSRFAGWAGCTGLSIANTCTVAMGIDHTVIADFEPASQLSLTVMVGGTGRGAIVSAPAGIDCGVICSAEFDEGSLVTLTATAAGGSRFDGWSGCASVRSPGSCRVTAGAGSSVGVTFTAEPVGPPPPQPQSESRTLTVATTGLGGATGKITSSPGGIDCGATCSHAYDRGAAVTLAAEPAPGSVFLGWGGCEAPTGSSCTQKLGSDRVIVASFGPAPISGLQVRKVAVKGKRATLTIAVPGPGELSGSGKWLRPASVLSLAAGDLVLHLRLSHTGEKAVTKARRRLAVRASVSFVSLQGGERVSVAQTLNFRRKAR